MGTKGTKGTRKGTNNFVPTYTERKRNKTLTTYTQFTPTGSLFHRILSPCTSNRIFLQVRTRKQEFKNDRSNGKPRRSSTDSTKSTWHGLRRRGGIRFPRTTAQYPEDGSHPFIHGNHKWMLCGYIGSHEFYWNSLFHLDAFGRERLLVSEDWGGSAKISERNWDGRVLVGGTAELFHEFHALLDSVLWTRLSVLGLDGVRYWALSLWHL
jgi:hypothetical protein